MRTADGHILRLPGERLDALMSQLRKPDVKQLVRSNYDGDMRRALARSVGQLSHNARRIGALRHVRSGRRYPVYSTEVGGNGFEIVTRPLEDGQEAVVSLHGHSYDSLAEYMSGSAPRPQFSEQMSFEQAINDPRSQQPGVYMIYNPDGTTYTGRSTKQTIRARLLVHRQNANRMNTNLDGHRVAVAPMPRSAEPRIVAAEKRVIRQERRAGRATNRREGELEAFGGAGEFESERFQPRVQRVRVVGRNANNQPIFRGVGRMLRGRAARRAALAWPGVIVAGTEQQARQFAQGINRGAPLRRDAGHGGGAPHYHVGQNDSHVWWGRNRVGKQFFID